MLTRYGKDYGTWKNSENKFVPKCRAVGVTHIWATHYGGTDKYNYYCHIYIKNTLLYDLRHIGKKHHT